MNRLTLAGIISYTALLACVGNGGGLKQVRSDTAASLVRDFQPIDEWSLWNGATQLRGANTWQRRPNPLADTVFPLYTQEDLKKLAAWGANYVNLSIPGPVAEDISGGEYPWDARVWANLDSMVTRADSAGLFVVVSFRTGPGRSEYIFDDEEEPAITHLWERRTAQDAWVRMWGETASRLKDRRAVVGYDLMVEPLLESENPRGSYAPEDWYRLANRLVDTIRKVDAVTPILVSVAPGGYASSVQGLDTTLLKPNTRRIVFTVHQYEPWRYTNQPVDTPRPFDRTTRRQLDAVYGQLKRWRDSVNVSLAVNEFGVLRWAVGADAFIPEQMRLIESVPANHALWVWDPSHNYIGWDQMNFRHGRNPANHTDDPRSTLAARVREWWTAENTVRLSPSP
jgi:hypothetical protein